MNERGWSSRAMVRYILFQVPELVLLILILVGVQNRVGLPSWLFWVIVILWVAKDVILFPFVRRSYDPHCPGANSMIGLRGIVKDRLAPSGYVQVGGELWQAEVKKGIGPVEKGEQVRIQEMRGLRLIVQPDNGSAKTRAHQR